MDARDWARKYPELQAFADAALSRFKHGHADALSEAAAEAEKVGLQVAFSFVDEGFAWLMEPTDIVMERARRERALMRAQRDKLRRPFVRALHKSLPADATGWSTRPNGLLFRGHEGFVILAVGGSGAQDDGAVPDIDSVSGLATITIGATSSLLPDSFGGRAEPPRAMAEGRHFNLTRPVALSDDETPETAESLIEGSTGLERPVRVSDFFEEVREGAEALGTNAGLLAACASETPSFDLERLWQRRTLVLLRALNGDDYAHLMDVDRAEEEATVREAELIGQDVHFERTKDYPQFWPHSYFAGFVATFQAGLAERR